jgi:hypothetical protein
MFICTEQTPWSENVVEKGTIVIHPKAEYLEDRDYGGGEYCERWHCPICGKYFEVELPQ